MTGLGSEAAFLVSAGCAAVLSIATFPVAKRRPVAGLIVVGATAAGLAVSRQLSPELVPGLIVLVGGGLLADAHGLFRGWTLLVLVGAVIIALGVPDSLGWPRVACAVSVGLGAPLLVEADRQLRCCVPALYGMSAAGVYAVVPDVEQALPLAGAAIPVALLGWPVGRQRFAAAGAVAAMGLFAWVVASGGYSRPSAVIGGLASLGVLLVVPLRSRRTPPPVRYRPFSLMAIHGATVLIVTRVAGMTGGVVPAITISAVTLVFASVIVGALARTQPERAD